LAESEKAGDHSELLDKKLSDKNCMIKHHLPSVGLMILMNHSIL
jgi:hypothetical protein